MRDDCSRLRNTGIAISRYFNILTFSMIVMVEAVYI